MILLSRQDRRTTTDGTFAKLFCSLLLFVYHCFDRIVIHGYLSGLSRPEQVVYFFRDVVGVPVVGQEVLSKRTGEYRSWVEAFARNHDPHGVGRKGVRKEDYVRPWLRRMERAGAVWRLFHFQSMEQGPTFRFSCPSFPPRIPTTASCARSAVASRTTISTCGMKRWGRW